MILQVAELLAPSYQNSIGVKEHEVFRKTRSLDALEIHCYDFGYMQSECILFYAQPMTGI